MTEQTDEDLARYRRERFAVMVEEPKGWHPKGQKLLLITHNGYQFSGIDFMPDEIDRIIEALQKAKHDADSAG